MRLLELLFMLIGFNVCYNGEVFTTTLFAQWICDLGVEDGVFTKIGKNYYKHIR